MKKQFLTIAIIGAAILALAYGSFASAQTPEPDPYGMMGEGRSHGDAMMGDGHFYGQGRTTEDGYGPGMMDEGTYGHGMGMMGVYGEMGALHDYMFPALAETLGLTPEEFQARHEAGETFWDIAETQGLDEVEAWELMEEAREEAMENAVEDGVITEAFGETMLDHMNGQHEDGRGHGGGPCDGEGPEGSDL